MKKKLDRYSSNRFVWHIHTLPVRMFMWRWKRRMKPDSMVFLMPCRFLTVLLSSFPLIHKLTNSLTRWLSRREGEKKTRRRRQQQHKLRVIVAHVCVCMQYFHLLKLIHFNLQIGFNAGNGTQAYEYKPYSQASVLRDLTGRGWANGFPGRHIFRIDERIMLGTCNKDIGMNFFFSSHSFYAYTYTDLSLLSSQCYCGCCWLFHIILLQSVCLCFIGILKLEHKRFFDA